MPDLDTRMPELLRRAAAGRLPDPGLERRVLRRARRRRVATATAGALAAVALVAGLGLGAGELLRADRATPGDQAPSPSPGAITTDRYLPNAVWPEVTRVALTDAQDLADAGEIAWRLDPVQTATAFAADVLGWDAADVVAEETRHPRMGTSFVTISNRGLGPGAGSAGPAAPQTTLLLGQLDRSGTGGIWSVTLADSDRILLDGLPRTILAGSAMTVGVGFDEAQVEWSASLELLVVADAPAPEGWYLVGPGELAGSTMIAGTVRVPDDALGTVGVVVRLIDPEGTTVAADIVPITVETSTAPGPAGVTGPSGTSGSVPTDPIGPGLGIPSAVLATRDAIAIAAETRDFEALERLIDPDHFSYNFDDGSNPVPEWRADPAVLDTLATILQMPFTTTEGTRDVGTIHVWPALTGSDLTNPTDDDREMLDTLGITDADVQAMLEAFGGYVGPRTGIAEDGTWLFYTIGGD